MRIIFAFCFLYTFSLYAFAGSMNDECLKEARAWVINEESKHIQLKPKDIKIAEEKVNGSASLLALLSLFVDSPKTGDNTHWEVVGEYNYKAESCRIVFGRRHWQH